MLDKQKHAVEIGIRLHKLYPEAHVELDYSTPFELMIASILAAQNTDKTINSLTPLLFRKYRGPADYLAVTQPELERDIHKSGFFRQKAKTIRGVCDRLLRFYEGIVPKTMEDLLTFPGIGRKTATVVLGDGMGITAGITIDVHNLRLTNRLGLSEKKTAEKMEGEMMEIVPIKDWIKWGQWITWHGRRVCKARTPLCGDCVLNDICPSAFTFGSG